MPGWNADAGYCCLGHATGEFPGEDDGGEFGRVVGLLAVVAAAGAVDIVEIQPSPPVNHADRVDDPRSVRSLCKSVEQEICQQKWSEVVDLESHLVAVGSCLAGEEQTPGVVGQNVDPRIAGEQFFGQAPHVVQGTEIREVRLGGDGGSTLRRSANHGHSSPQLPEAPGCSGADS
jgi:hypothetical protein